VCDYFPPPRGGGGVVRFLVVRNSERVGKVNRMKDYVCLGGRILAEGALVVE